MYAPPLTSLGASWGCVSHFCLSCPSCQITPCSSCLCLFFFFFFNRFFCYFRQLFKIHSPDRYSGLENSMDYTVQGVTKSQTRLSDFRFRFSLLIDSSWCDIWLIFLVAASLPDRPRACQWGLEPGWEHRSGDAGSFTERVGWQRGSLGCCKCGWPAPVACGEGAGLSWRLDPGRHGHSVPQSQQLGHDWPWCLLPAPDGNVLATHFSLFISLTHSSTEECFVTQA